MEVAARHPWLSGHSFLQDCLEKERHLSSKIELQMPVLRFIQELLGIRPGITKGPQSRNVKKDVESERQHFLGADSGQCRGEDSGKPFPPLKKNRPEIDYQWWGQPLFQHGIDDRDQLAVFRRIDVSLGHDGGDLGHAGELLGSTPGFATPPKSFKPGLPEVGVGDGVGLGVPPGIRVA